MGLTSTRFAIVAICMAAVAGYSRAAVAAGDTPRTASLPALPLSIDGWRGVDRPLDRGIEQVLNADSYIFRTYSRGASAAGLYVAFYASQRAGHTVHSPLNCLPGTGWDLVEQDRESIRSGGEAFDVNRDVVQKGSAKQIVYYWYQSRRRAVASEYAGKLLLVRDALTLGRSDGAIVRVTAPIDSTRRAELASFVRAVYPLLSTHLPE